MIFFFFWNIENFTRKIITIQPRHLQANYKFCLYGDNNIHIIDLVMKNKINCHIYREANMVADALVNLFGHKSERIITFGFVTLLPPVFSKKYV